LQLVQLVTVIGEYEHPVPATMFAASLSWAKWFAAPAPGALLLTGT